MPFQFQWPWFLLMLPCVAFLVYRYWQSIKPAIKFSGLAINSPLSKDFSVWMRIMALSLMVIALARPQWGEWHSEEQARDLILALDVSGSMRTVVYDSEGSNNSRYDVLKRQVRTFLSGLTTDRIGVIVFADEALTLIPLTSDLASIPQILDYTRSGMIGEKTAIDAAVLLAVSRLQKKRINTKKTSQAIILFTDGLQTASSFRLEKAFAVAKAAKIRVYTVMDGEAVRQNNKLMPLSQSTGGKGFLLSQANSLDAVLMAIKTLEKASLKGKTTVVWKDVYTFPFLMGLLLLLSYEFRSSR